MNKFAKVISEAALIVIIASVLGIFYHTVLGDSPKVKETKIEIVSDSLLKSGLSASDEVGFVSYEQVKKLIDDPEVFIIDARSPENYSRSHIKGAKNIFPYSDDYDFMGEINMLDTEKLYIVYCDGGKCDLSHEVAKVMKEFQFPRVFIYKNGWEEWSVKEKLSS